MTYLDRIIDWHRDRAARDPRRAEELLDQARTAAKAKSENAKSKDRFVNALREGLHLNVIAEIKRRSPSRGDIAPNLRPRDLAAEYVSGGASCLSVLTDEPHFGGSVADLIEARAESGLPVLRKDFTVDARDVMDACIMGADAVLLIVAALTNSELARLLALSAELGLAVLVEVHDEVELARAVELGASLVGVNQRNLRTFEVDPRLAERLAPRIPSGVLSVAESGIGGAIDARRCADAGYRAVLVGEHLVRSSDRSASLRELRVVLPS